MENFDIDYNMLKVFDALWKTHSLSQSAQQLKTSLSSNSRALAKLQALFDDKLFIRSSQGMTPTPRAYELYPTVHELLKNFDQLQHKQVFEPSTLKRTFTIGTADNGVLCILRPVIHQILKTAPDVNLDFKPLGSDMYASLKNGDLDIALYPSGELPENFHGLRLFEITRSCLVRKGHPLAVKYKKEGKIELQDFSAFPKIVVSMRQGAKAPVFDVDSELLGEQRTIIRLPYFLAAPLLLEGTDYTLMLPTPTAEHAAQTMDLEIVPYPNDAIRYVTRLVWHERVHHDPAIQWLRALFGAYSNWKEC